MSPDDSQGTPQSADSKALASLADSAERIANTLDILKVGMTACRKLFDETVARVEQALKEDSQWPDKIGQQMAHGFHQVMRGFMGYNPEDN